MVYKIVYFRISSALHLVFLFFGLWVRVIFLVRDSSSRLFVFVRRPRMKSDLLFDVR